MTTTILTAAALASITARLAAADDDVRAAALEELGAYMGTGEPADAERAEELGPDYVCAMDDGRIVAWGAEYVIRPSVTGREIIVY